MPFFLFTFLSLCIYIVSDELPLISQSLKEENVHNMIVAFREMEYEGKNYTFIKRF